MLSVPVSVFDLHFLDGVSFLHNRGADQFIVLLIVPEWVLRQQQSVPGLHLPLLIMLHNQFELHPVYLQLLAEERHLHQFLSQHILP